MKPSILLSSVVLASLAGAFAPVARGAGPLEIMKPAPAAVPAASAAAASNAGVVGAWVTAMNQASEPSAAVQVYAMAMAAFPDNAEITRAYVRRLVVFGLPEMAGTQAQRLIDQRQADGLCWAVAGYMSGKRDEPTVALIQLEGAVGMLPEDTFVQRTAGQLVAWYDTRANWRVLSEEVKAAVVTIKQKLAAEPVYDEAYRQASAAYLQMANVPATTRPEGGAGGGVSPAAPAVVAGGAATTVPAGAVVPGATPGSSYGSGGVMANPYYPNYADTSAYVWAPVVPDAYVSYWWPSFPALVVVGQGEYFRHHHHDGDGLGRGFNGGVGVGSQGTGFGSGFGRGAVNLSASPWIGRTAVPSLTGTSSVVVRSSGSGSVSPRTWSSASFAAPSAARTTWSAPVMAPTVHFAPHFTPPSGPMPGGGYMNTWNHGGGSAGGGRGGRR